MTRVDPEIRASLVELSSKLAESRSTTETLKTLARAGLTWMGADRVALWLRSHSTAAPEVVVAEGLNGPWLTADVEDPLVTWLFDRGELTRVANADPDDAQALSGTSRLGAPLWHGGAVTGALVYGSDRPDRFTLEDEDVALFLANLAVTVVERARLVGSTFRDPVTQCWTERYFEPRLREEVDRATRLEGGLCLVCVGLDHFERLTWSFGLRAGDDVLRAIADRVRAAVRSYDVLGRLGDRDFVVLLPGATEEEASGVADRIRAEVLSSPVEITAARWLRPSVSTAVARWEAGEEPSALLVRAKGALAASRPLGSSVVAAPPPTSG